MKKLIVLLVTIIPLVGYSQCNIQSSICTPGIAGPFNFIATNGSLAGGSYNQGSCSTGIGGLGNDFGFIILNITSSGPLNLLINGNSNNGFLDVIAFNIPPGTLPCTAIQNPANEIGCNFASSASGCVQFGNAFPCVSTVPAPNVVAGQQIMIIVHDWSNTHNTFTLQLGQSPGAQTGPPNSTINPAGPFCVTSPSTQLQSVNMGGTWSGPGVSPTGLFNPAIAGVGTHTITYSLGQSPCNSSSTIQITVNPQPIVNPTSTNVTCFGNCDGTANTNLTGAYIWSPGGQTTQTITGLCPGTYTVTVNQNGCIGTGSVTITQPPQLTIANISHN